MIALLVIAPLVIAPLVIKVAHAGKYHGNTSRISRRNHVIILDRSARLNHRCCPRFDQGFKTIGKWEKRI